MKRLLIIATVIISACSTPKPVALKGNYEGPRIIETKSSFDQVWDKLIDMFAQKGLSIKIIDRSSGLIISERALLPTTIELNSGALKDPQAFALTTKIYDRYTKKNKPVYSELTGEWNVRIKKTDTGTSINVNVVNIEGKGIEMRGGRFYEKWYPCYACKSTGVFEQIISDIIK